LAYQFQREVVRAGGICAATALRHSPREKPMKSLTRLGLALGVTLALAGAAQAQIKLGMAGPITGPNAAFGAQLKNGVEQAVEDINAAGGILGQKITLSTGDDVSDPKQGVSVANKFVADGIKFVMSLGALAPEYSPRPGPGNAE